MKNLMMFEGNNVEVIENNGEILFELYSTGMVLGYTTISKGKVYPHKTRINKVIVNAEISTVVHGVQQYLTESQLYDFMFEVKTDKCKPFRKWVTEDVLPSIRKSGGFVSKDREGEFIDNYFPSFSEDVKLAMVQDLRVQNQKMKIELKNQKPKVDIADKRLLKNGCYTLTEVTKSLGLKRGQITKWAKENGYIHKKIVEINKKGEDLFKMYDNGGFKNIGITEEGLKLVNEYLVSK